MIAVNYIWKHLVFAYPKRERYYISSLCFEMARQMTLSTQSIPSCEARGAAEPRRKLTNFMVQDLSEQFGWYGALAERAERPSLATKIITKGRFGL
jgi:hypothetical protein